MTTDRQTILSEIFFIFIAPVALIATGIISVEWRMLMLCISMLLMYGIIVHEQIPDSAMGLNPRSFRKGIIPYTLFTVAGIVVLAKVAHYFELQSVVLWWKSPHLIFLFLPVSMLQEIAYRGFLFYKLKLLSSKWWFIILFNVLLFTFLHVIYPVPLVMLPVAMVGGLCFALMYRYFPSIILISLAHAALNFAAIFYGFFTIH
jgi:membrane protease YdiL (CAAX protease family)